MARTTETMTLPSRGLFYDGLMPEGIVEYFPMTAKEEKLLAGGFKDGNLLIDAILNACVPTLPIPIEDMLIGDKFFMMLAIRAASYGSDYGMEIKCEGCDTKFRHTVNLGFSGGEEEFEGIEDQNTFYIKVLDDNAKEPFEITLPRCGDTIQFRLLRGRDEKAIAKHTEQSFSKRKGKADGSPSYIYRICRHIVSVNGAAMDALELRSYVEGLIGLDSAYLRTKIDEVDVGVDTTFKAECPRCDEEVESTITLGGEFFRPQF